MSKFNEHWIDLETNAAPFIEPSKQSKQMAEMALALALARYWSVPGLEDLEATFKKTVAQTMNKES